MKRQLIISVGIIVFIVAVSVGATGAFFSDSETSTGNTFTAGKIDLKVDSQCHYYQDGKDVGCGNFGTWTETDLRDGVHKFFDFRDVKPGDNGEDTISLHVYDNDAWGKFGINQTSSLDNLCTEPETGAEPTCGNDNIGELAAAMTTTVWLDQGSTPGFQNVGADGQPIDADPATTDVIEKPDPTEGDNIQQEEPTLVSGVPFFNTTFTLSDVLSSAYEAADCTVETGANNYGPCQGLALDGRMVGSTTYYFGWRWDLPSAVGNEVQTDSVNGDVVFNVVQHRNNPTQTGL